MAFTEAKSSIRALATARAISITGGAAAFIALQYSVSERTGSAVMVAITLLGTFGVANVLQGPLGALGDRFDRRWVMIGSDLVAGSLFLLMAFVGPIKLLMFIAFLSAVAEAPMWATSGAVIPALVGDDSQISWANSLVTMGVHFGIFLGPLIGGSLVGVIGANRVFALNAASFVVSAVLVYSVRRPFREQTEAGTGEHKGITAGMRFVLRDDVLRVIALGWFVLVLGIGIQLAADPDLSKVFKVGALGYGAIVAAWGLGSVAGSGLGRFLKRPSEGTALVYCTAVVGFASIGAGAAPWFVLLLVMLFLNGLTDSISMVAETNIAQRRAPEAVRTRVMGAMMMIPGVAFVVSFAGAGFIINAIGARGAYVAAGFLELGAAMISYPIIKRLRRDHASGAAREGDDIVLVEPQLPVV